MLKHFKIAANDADLSWHVSNVHEAVQTLHHIHTGDLESISMSGSEMDGEAVLYDYVNWMNLNLKVN